MFCLLLTIRGAFPLLVLGPVFKTGEGSGNRLLVGSIPMRSRQPFFQRPHANADQISWTCLACRK
jgi:hypothetical protein